MLTFVLPNLLDTNWGKISLLYEVVCFSASIIPACVSDIFLNKVINSIYSSLKHRQTVTRKMTHSNKDYHLTVSISWQRRTIRLV